MTTGRILRRVGFELRRDAAQELSNGRVLYDALFSRWGLQSYPGGVEFRPFDEVERSMETIALSPGVLLHPSANYGTDFGAGAYPVRGCVAEDVRWADDQIHTQGKLMVWDAEWNGQILSRETIELSMGYSIEPDNTPGQAPDGAPGSLELGLDYVSIQRDIICDHCAGVPEGNAGTARVVADAATAGVPMATRATLAKIAAARMDARTLYFDIGQWPTRTRQDAKPVNKQAKFLARLDEFTKAGRHGAMAIHDAWVDVYGESDDPDMRAMLTALGKAPAGPAPATTAAPVADEEHEEPEPAAGEGEAANPAAAPAEKAPAEGEAAADPEEEEAREGGAGEKMDAAKLAARLDAVICSREDARAEAVFVARSLFGSAWQPRADQRDPKSRRLTTDEIHRACVAKVDSSGAEEIERLDAADGRVATRLAFARVQRQVLDAAPQRYVEELCAQINATRTDTKQRADAALLELADRLNKIDTEAGKVARPTA